MEEPQQAVSYDPQLLRDLQTLARAVTLDGSVDVEISPRAKQWNNDSLNGIITVPALFLTEFERDDILGRLCMEAAQLAITRFGRFVPPALLVVPGRRALLGILEFVRSSKWLLQRFPGLATWITDVTQQLIEFLLSKQLPLFLQFCLGALCEATNLPRPEGFAPPVNEALDKTLDARKRFIEQQPPTQVFVPPELTSLYAQSPVRRAFEFDDQLLYPDDLEQVVRVCSFEAWKIFWVEINPHYEPLVEEDRNCDCNCESEEAPICNLMPDCGARPNPRRRRPGRRKGTAGATPQFLRGSCDNPGDGLIAEEYIPGRGFLSDEEFRKRLLKETNRPAPEGYEGARSFVAPHIETLVRELERILRPNSYPRWQRGFPSGAAIDMPAAMRFEADPSTYVKLWKRKTIPKKRDWRFLVLLDLSGSMSGEKTTHAFRGVVLTAEVLNLLGVPFAVHGFQDKLIRFKDFAEPLDSSSRARIGTMPMEVDGTRPGGNNNPGDNFDGPVLRTVSALMEDEPGNPKVLIVLSDGEPSGPSDASGELHRAIAAIQNRGELVLVGVGIGPDTAHVSNYYPEAIANVPLETFALSLGSCLERHLLA